MVLYGVSHIFGVQLGCNWTRDWALAKNLQDPTIHPTRFGSQKNQPLEYMAHSKQHPDNHLSDCPENRRRSFDSAVFETAEWSGSFLRVVDIPKNSQRSRIFLIKGVDVVLTGYDGHLYQNPANLFIGTFENLRLYIHWVNFLHQQYLLISPWILVGLNV